MDLFLRAANGRYLVVGEGPAFASSPQAPPNSLIALDNYDPVSHGVPADRTLRSHNLISLRTPDGTMLTARDPSGMNRLIADPALRVPDDAPRIGYDAYRMILMGGSKGAMVSAGDKVAFQLVTPEGESRWLSVQAGTDEVAFLDESSVDPETVAFELYPSVDMIDFALDYVDFDHTIVGMVWLSGPALPGGHGVTLSSDGGSILELPHLVIEKQETQFIVPAGPEFGSISPCAKHTLNVTATFDLTGASFNQELPLEGERVHFMQMRIKGIKKVGSMPGVIKAVTRTPDTFEALAELFLDPYEQRLNDAELPLAVELSCDDPQVKDFIQKSNQLTREKPIRFTFSVVQPPEDTPRTCTLIRATFTMGGKDRRPVFPLLIAHRGLALDPQK